MRFPFGSANFGRLKFFIYACQAMRCACPRGDDDPQSKTTSKQNPIVTLTADSMELGDLTSEPTWQQIQDFYNKNSSKLIIKDLFAQDSNRFKDFSLKLNTPNDGDILIDYSKNRINAEVLQLLFALARARKIDKAREAMFTGEKINFTEDRAVLHVALRNRANKPILVDGKDVTPDVNAVLEHMKQFTNSVLSGQWRG